MKIPGYLLLGLLLSSMVFATDNTEENFDRLFTTAVERKNLDLARTQGRLFGKPAVENIDTSSTEVQLKKPESVKMSGIILRADGKSQVWVSGKPQYTSLRQLNADKNNSSDLRIPLSGKSILLKPGQVLANGKAKEAYYFVTQSSNSSASRAPAPAVENLVSSSSASSVASSSVSSQANVNVQTKTP